MYKIHEAPKSLFMPIIYIKGKLVIYKKIIFNKKCFERRRTGQNIK